MRRCNIYLRAACLRYQYSLSIQPGGKSVRAAYQYWCAIGWECAAVLCHVMTSRLRSGMSIAVAVGNRTKSDDSVRLRHNALCYSSYHPSIQIRSVHRSDPSLTTRQQASTLPHHPPSSLRGSSTPPSRVRRSSHDHAPAVGRRRRFGQAVQAHELFRVYLGEVQVPTSDSDW
jgi:hypothetical protein